MTDIPDTGTPDTGRLDDDDMTTDPTGPTEMGEDRDAGGSGEADTGDETTEDREDRDAGGEGPMDAGDES